MKTLTAVLLICMLASTSWAELKTQKIIYGPPDDAMEGFLAYDDSFTAPRPGVLVVHEWWGLNDYIRSRALQLASLGYVAFAADIYGQGIRAKTAAEAGKLAKKFISDRKLLQSRARAGLAVLLKNERVDKSRLAAIGYCFGGTTVLELARSGADLKGIVSFHGVLDTPSHGEVRNIKGSILVLTGALDPYVPASQRDAFMQEMKLGKADWEMIIYGNAVHSFTNPASGDDPSRGVAYDPRADQRSWQAMQDFFNEVLKK